MKPITENHIEAFAIEQLQALGWQYLYGLAIAPGAEVQVRVKCYEMKVYNIF